RTHSLIQQSAINNQQFQKLSLSPNLNSRDRPAAIAVCVEVTLPKFELFTLPLGLLKCGVLVALNASARNCKLVVEPSLNVRNRLRSRLATPGPRIVLRPTLPNRT